MVYFVPPLFTAMGFAHLSQDPLLVGSRHCTRCARTAYACLRTAPRAHCASAFTSPHFAARLPFSAAVRHADWFHQDWFSAARFAAYRIYAHLPSIRLLFYAYLQFLPYDALTNDGSSVRFCAYKSRWTTPPVQAAHCRTDTIPLLPAHPTSAYLQRLPSTY